MNDALKSLLRVAAGVALIVAVLYVGGRLFLFDIASVEGNGMLPTFGKGAYIVSWKRTKPRRGDVILFRRDGTFRARRVIGLPGDRIEFDDFIVTVNGERAKYREGATVRIGGRRAIVMRETLSGASYDVIDIKGRRIKRQEPVEVEGGYFVLSDHREMGINGDSRVLGVIKPREILGVVRWILSPGEQVGAGD